jgi:hypothetical protein
VALRSVSPTQISLRIADDDHDDEDEGIDNDGFINDDSTKSDNNINNTVGGLSNFNPSRTELNDDVFAHFVPSISPSAALHGRDT